MDQTNAAGQTSDATSADDVLSQLAGDEIDRLLAEAENEKPRPPAPAPNEVIAPEPSPAQSPTTASPTTPDDDNEALAAQLKAALLESNDSPSVSFSAEPAAPVVPRIEDASDEIDRLLAAAEAANHPTPAAKESEPPTPPAPETSGLHADASAVPLDEAAKPAEAFPPDASSQTEPHDPHDPAEHATSAVATAETPPAPSAVAPATEPLPDALPDAPKPAANSQPSAAQSKIAPPAKVETESVLNPSAAGAVEDDGPLPLYLRILDLIIWPLEYLPDGLLDSLGKIGVVTTINAIAVILYVVVIRHHHGKRTIPPAAQAPHVSAASDHNSARSASDARTQKHGS